jgi:tol-pal system protein YbgF
MKPTGCLLLIIIASLLGCASQGDVISLDERLAILEIQQSKLKNQYSEVKTDTKKRDVKDETFRTQSAGLRIQIQNLREEIQILNGKLEEIEHFFNQEKRSFEASKNRLEKQLAKLIEINDSNKKRLQEIEKYLDLESTETGAQSKIDQGIKTGNQNQKTLSEDELYKTAKQAFDKLDFDTARERFDLFIQKYPKSRNADNAQFWIGEIYYREKWYDKAILEYEKVIQQYPKGNKVKDALLKQGYAWNNIGEKSNARIVLKELIKKYPGTNQAKIAKKKLSLIK